jgi:hypothetical protein
MRNDRIISGPHKQKGVVTLAISLLLLGLITLVSLYTSRTVALEQKISNNDSRSRQALSHAEAGYAAAIMYLNEDPDVDNDGVIDEIYDTDNDGVGDTDTANTGTGSVTVNVTDISGGSMTLIRLVSRGFSDDFSATRTVTQVVGALNPLSNAPGVPLIAHGSVVIDGSTTVTNPEGHSTIWSGDDVDLGSNNSTGTNIADFDDANYPGCMGTPLTCGTVSSSNKLLIGPDVIEYDSALSSLSGNGFFENFFGMSPADYRQSMVTLETTGANADSDIELAAREVIWVEGDVTLSSSPTVGCTSPVSGSNVCPAGNQKPSILIVNGDLTLQGTPHFYGLVFVTGSIDLSANATVYGALVVAGGVANQTGGSLDITYHSGLLGTLRNIGPLGSVAGTWKDFL